MKKCFLVIVAMLGLLVFQGCDKDSEVTYSELPQNARVFIDSYFPLLDVVYAEKRKDGKKTIYEVVLDKGVLLHFNSSGDWIYIDCQTSALPEGVLPTKIAEYINEHYSGYTMRKVDIRYGRYDVTTTTGLILIFSVEGIFISAQGG